MAANMYDQAAQAQFINTYVPIDFGNLYRIAKDQEETIRKAGEQMTNALVKFGEFTSISDLDVKDYYDSSIGKLKNLIDYAAQNPDAFKDAAFRSQLQMGLNSIDYNYLAGLRKSAENMDQREKAVATLKAAGLYSEWFDDQRYVDLRNWSTRDNGIMKNLSPDKYQSMEELGREYVKDLKPTFYKGVAPNSGVRMPYTNWMAISRNDIKRAINDHANDILNTSAGQKHFARFANMYKNAYPDATYQDIRDSFVEALTTEQSDKMIETPLVDTASLQMSLAAYTRTPRNSGSNSGNAKPLLYPTDLSILQNASVSRKAKEAGEMNPGLMAQIQADNARDAENIMELYQQFAENPETSVKMAQYAKAAISRGLISQEDLEDPQKNLGLVQTLINYAVNGLDQSGDLYKNYKAVQNQIASNVNRHNGMLAHSLVETTLRAHFGKDPRLKEGVESRDPLEILFEHPSSAGMRGIDDAVTSIMGDIQLNKPDSDLLLSAIFGEDENGKHVTTREDLKRTESSFDYLYRSYPYFAAKADKAAQNESYTGKVNEGGKLTLISEINPGFFSFNLDNYSIRNNAAAGKYGNLVIDHVKGFTPVNGGDPYEYAFQVSVKVPLEKIQEDMGTVSKIDKDDIWRDEGLHVDDVKEIDMDAKGKKLPFQRGYVEVPVVINKVIPPSTKRRLDALYLDATKSTTELKKANEQQTAIQSVPTQAWLNLREN